MASNKLRTRQALLLLSNDLFYYDNMFKCESCFRLIEKKATNEPFHA